MSTSDIDVSEVPNFTVVRTRIPHQSPVQGWLNKLQTWCEGSVKDRARLERNASDLNDRISDLEQEASKQRDAEDFIERIEERLSDTERGIYTLHETMDWLRRENR